MQKITAVIPCYNEAKTIAGLVAKAKEYCHRVIVVDNMSTDNTREEAEKETACYNVFGCCLRGAGIATAYGLAYSLNDIVVTLDGDGQHNPDDIPFVVRPILQGKADLVIGSRFLGHCELPKYRKFGIDVITWLYNFGRRDKITDAQSCFRAYSRKCLKRILPIEEHGFSFSVETLVKARALGLRIAEVPIDVVYHKDFSSNSSLNPVAHGLSVAFGVVKWRIKIEKWRKK